MTTGHILGLHICRPYIYLVCWSKPGHQILAQFVPSDVISAFKDAVTTGTLTLTVPTPLWKTLSCCFGCYCLFLWFCLFRVPLFVISQDFSSSVSSPPLSASHFPPVFRISSISSVLHDFSKIIVIGLVHSLTIPLTLWYAHHLDLLLCIYTHFLCIPLPICVLPIATVYRVLIGINCPEQFFFSYYRFF